MLSIIEDTCVTGKQWITHEEMMDMTVIAESTPGPIAINCATYTGYKTAGFLGALVATVGIAMPSFFIIWMISMFLDNFLELTLIAYAFCGIKIAVGILILDAGFTMMKKMAKKKLNMAIMASSCVIMLCINIFALKFSSIALMLCAGAVSLSIFLATAKKGGDRA